MVVRRWQGDPRWALAVLGGLLAVVPFALLLLAANGFDPREIEPLAVGQTLPALLLFGTAGGVFGLLYR